MWNPIAWILLPVIGAALVWNLLWLAGGSERPGLARLAAWDEAPEPWPTLARGLYLAGIPLLALALRVVPPERMGLQAPATRPGTALALGAALAVALAAMAAEGHYHRALGVPVRWVWRRPGAAALGSLALGALFAELHWAFFRAGTLSLGLPGETRALGLALALLALEAWTDPRRRAALSEPGPARGLARGAALALLSSTTFLLTASSLLAILLHLAVAGLWQALPARPGTRQPPAAPPDEGPRPAIEPTVV